MAMWALLKCFFFHHGANILLNSAEIHFLSPHTGHVVWQNFHLAYRFNFHSVNDCAELTGSVERLKTALNRQMTRGSEIYRFKQFNARKFIFIIIIIKFYELLLRALPTSFYGNRQKNNFLIKVEVK